MCVSIIKVESNHNHTYGQSLRYCLSAWLRNLT